MHRIAALCLDGVIAFDLAAPVQAFALALSPRGEPLYEVSSCSLTGNDVSTSGDFSLRPRSDISALASADTVLVPGYANVFEPPPEPTLAALRAAAARGTRLVSICSGAFALAHAGLLDHRRATTHWAAAALLAGQFPAVTVDSDALFVDEGDVMTSAGLSAGIDLALHVIRADFGAAVADRVARHMVAAPFREGGQAQFVKRDPIEAGGSLEPTRRWAAERLQEPLDVETMSARAGVSPRTFARRFRAETGTTPLQWVLAQRVLEARRLLEESDLPIDAIAWRAGFGTAASMRKHFRRATSTTPSAYRSAFRPVAEPSSA